MNRLAFLYLAFAVACVSLPTQPVPAPPGALIAAVGITVTPAVAGVHLTLGDTQCDTDARGIGYCVPVLQSVTTMQVGVPDGYLPVEDQAVTLHDGNNEVVVALTAKHVDPSTVPLSVLARIRGAMWLTPLANLPPKDRIAFAFYPFYSPEDRARMIAGYVAPGYTHAVSGPIAGTDCYHGWWPCHDTKWRASMPEDGVPSQDQFDAYLDALQELWDGHLIPVCFVKPDGWERRLDLLDQLDTLYAQPRAQALCRVVVYPGWEPSGDKYGWSNAIYVAMVARGARVFPNALRLLHTVIELDAPTGQNDDQLGMTNGLAWRNVAPYIHGWLAQYGGYAMTDDCTPTAAFKHDFGEALADQIQRFRTGRGGWPTGSAWGPNTPVDVYAGEYASYVGFRQNCDQAASIELGNIAIAAGVAGYLDGGSVNVPAR